MHNIKSARTCICDKVHERARAGSLGGWKMNLKNPKDVGALVRDRRKRQNLTQAMLAEKAGVSRRWLAGLEAGKSGAELGMVFRVLSSLRINVGVEFDAAETQNKESAGTSTASVLGRVSLDELLDSYGPDPR